jgi:hypothetical protein
VYARGKEGEDHELSPDVLEGRIEEVFKNFRNGLYRLYLQEAESERVRWIRDVQVYQGRVVTPDFRENVGERQPGGAQETKPESRPAEAKLDDDQSAPKKPAAEASKPPAASKADSGEATPKGDQPAAPFGAGVAIGAGLVAQAARGRWSDQVDRAFEAGPYSLSKAARLCRRIRRRQTR